MGIVVLYLKASNDANLKNQQLKELKMGNRALITAARQKDNQASIYLHWNGGIDSVEPFLYYCKLHGYRGFGADTSYAIARLTQVIANYFGGNLSIGVVGGISYAEDFNNGIYYIKDWDIVKHETPYAEYKEQRDHPFDDMLKDIDASQPLTEQLGDMLNAKLTNVNDLELGDRVYKSMHNRKPELYTVIGFGECGRVVNGQDVSGAPIVNYTNAYMPYEDNINNYLYYEKEYFVKSTS